jgi:hypothetical protein
MLQCHAIVTYPLLFRLALFIFTVNKDSKPSYVLHPVHLMSAFHDEKANPDIVPVGESASMSARESVRLTD